MDFSEAKSEVKQLLGRVMPSELPRLLDWIRTSGKLEQNLCIRPGGRCDIWRSPPRNKKLSWSSDICGEGKSQLGNKLLLGMNSNLLEELDDLLVDNRRATLQSIAEDLRARLPLDAMLPSESGTQLKMQQRSMPTVHVDAFLYNDQQVDALCEEGTMSRSYCLACGSVKTAPLDFLSHSFSVSELQFLFQNVLPDLSGRMLVDVGSRLGAVLYGGYVYSSASCLLGLELSEEFVRLQQETPPLSSHVIALFHHRLYSGRLSDAAIGWQSWERQDEQPISAVEAAESLPPYSL